MKYPICLLALISLTISLSGCSTLQGWFAADCECEPAEPCHISEEDIAWAMVKYEVESAYLRASAQGAQLGVVEEDDDGDESVRTADQLAYDRIDPTIPDAQVSFDDDEARQAFEERYGVDVPEGAQVFRHRFHPDDPSAIAVHLPGHYLRIYEDGSPSATLQLDHFDDSVPDGDELPVKATAIRLVRDRPTQLQLLHADTDEEGVTTYYLGIYKMIGPKIGTIFLKPVAHFDDEGSRSPLAEVGYLYGFDARIIEWLPVDDEGDSDAEPRHYKWNQWEGVYRVPKPPPTAPDRLDS